MSLLAAIAAIPKLVNAIDRLGDTIKSVEESRIDNKYTELKGKIDEITIKIENATTDEDRRALVRDLNLSISE